MLLNFQETLGLFKIGQLMHLWMNFVLVIFGQDPSVDLKITKIIFTGSIDDATWTSGCYTS